MVIYVLVLCRAPCKKRARYRSNGGEPCQPLHGKKTKVSKRYYTTTLGELVDSLGRDLPVTECYSQDDTFTITVAPNGDATTHRNSQNDYRSLYVKLPVANRKK